MKKSYFWGLLLAIMALIPSQNAFAEYCTMSSTFSNSDRHLDSFTLTDGVEELAVSSVQPNSGSNWWPSYKVYNDHTSKSLTTQPGATLYFKSLSWTGSWMHGYVFIDYNQDETFDASEAVSYNFYSEAGTDTGVNSKGESVSNNCGVTAGSMPSWTLPADLASGTYRLRLKIDWNSLDACGASDIVTNRGCIADITLNVEAAIPERTIDVTVTPEGAGTVTGAGTAMGNITLVATPTPGYEFVNWTLNGEVVSTEMSYTDATEGNKSYVANFAALTAYPEMSYFYTNGANQANRYLKEVVATAGETVTTVFSATTEAELPKVDPDVIGSATTQGAYVDKTENPIIIPEGTTEFTVNFKAWTAAMTISGESATTQLQWTQQAAFIDWNNNFCFYEEGENYGKSSDTMGNDGGVCQSFISETGYTRTFSVPADVKPGVYRMRVCYFEPDGNNAQQWQNTIFEKGNCTTRNGKTYDFAIEVIGVTPETPVYAVSVATADEAMGTAEVSATEVEEGTEVTFTATAAEGYQFVNWTSGEEVVSTENPYTVAVTAEMALTANFELIPVTKYTVTVNAGVGGTAEVSATEVEEGTEVTFTATAAEGYQFVNWTSGEEVVSTENPYTVAVTAEMALTANFELIPVTKYTVTVNAGVGGKAEASATEVEEGTEVTLTATADFGYQFTNWTSSAVAPVYYIQNYNTKKYLGYNTANLAAVDEQTSDATFTPSTMNEGEFTIFLTNATYNQETPAKPNSYMHCGSNGRFSGNSVNTSASQQIAIFKVEDPTAETITATKVSEITAGATYMFVGLKSGVYYALTDELYEANHATDQRMVGAEVTITDGTITFTPGASSALWTIVNKAVASTENPYTVTVTSDVEYTANFEAVEVTPAIIVKHAEANIERQFTFSATEEGAKVFIDWGNGELQEYAIAYYNNWDPYQTTINGTILGDGTVTIYGDKIHMFDCSYSASYPVKVTDIDVSACATLYDLSCYTNEITSLDFTSNAALAKVYANGNSALNSITFAAENAITTLDLNDCGFTTLDLSSCTSLTSVKLNNNPLGSIDVSANTALTTLYANNTGLTTIDLSANTKLKNLYVNENQLTSLNISTLVAGSYTFANDNQLTELITAPEMLTSKTRINIKNNNFTLATLPAITGINAYNYAPQNAMTIATEITEGEELDLSSQAMVGENATVYTWYTAEGEEFTGYTVEGGKFVFDVEADTELYCTMTNASFDKFSGTNALATTNIVVKNLTPAIIVKHAEANIERQFTFSATEEGAKVFIDWGNGELQEYAIAYYNNWDPYQTTINGTILGDGTVTIYGDKIHMFDCSYSASYPVKVTDIDVSACATLYDLSCYTNEITSLDFTSNAALAKVYANGNSALNSITFAAENAITTLDLNDCGFTTLDLSSCTSLTSVKLNNNPLGSIDVSANTALTTLYANNTGLTTIDLSANTKLKNLYVNENQLTSLNISTLVAGSYTFANDNQLTELITAPEMLTSKTRINIKNNNFTLATLPAITGINAYNYAPQNAMTIATEITEGEELDLSSQAMVGENATVYTWYTAEGEEFTGYTVEGGKFVFDVEADTELYCTMTNASFDKFSGTNALATTNILVKYVAPTTYTVTVTTFDGGTVAIQGYEGETAQIEEGTQVTVVATPAEGFEFVSWTDADDAWDTDLTFDAEYTFTVTRDINLKAWFSQLPVVTTCQVLVNIAPTEDYGTVVIEGVEGLLAEVEVGTEVTAVATPAEGKIFEGWFTFEGDELSTNVTYTFTATEDVIVVAWFTDAPEAEYCTYEGKSTHSERRLNAVTITDGTNSTAVSSIQPYFRGDVYVDKTDVVFPSYAGATVNFSEFDFKGEWMHAYVYIDYNNDKVFDTTVNADGTTGGELVAFTFYSETDSGTGVNSLGETVSNYTIPMVSYLPAFTLPADLAQGEYRVRVKTDWCHLDPCGHPTESANKLTANGACIADFTMSIDEENGVEFAEADGAQVYAADGVIYINGYEGDVKVVNVAGQVVKDVNVNGNDKLEMAAGLYMVVTGDQVTKVVVK